MEIRTIPVEQIKPAAYNPRRQLRPGDLEWEKLVRSIETFGFVEPLVWNRRTGNLVGGHQRLAVLIGQGAREVECSVVDLDDTQERQLNLALNRIEGGWDDEKLSVLLEELEAEGADLALTGFDEAEVEALLAAAAEPGGPVDDDGFDADAVAAAITNPVTRPGDVWLLGRHRLMCGDATSVVDAKRLMAGYFADMVFTDPPYNVDYMGKTADAMKIQNDNMEPEEFRRFLRASFTSMHETARPGAPIYVCHAEVGGILFRQAFIDAGWLFKQCLIWVKNGIVLGRQDYQWQHEPILYGWKPGAGHSWYGDRDKSTVIDDDIDTGALSRKELAALVDEFRNNLNTTVVRENKPHVNDIHPTMKPISLVARFVRNSSHPDHRVQDLFGGGGSTLMACHQIGRIAYTMEIDPRYCDAIIQRWQAFTGQQAIREGDGTTFH